jgi:hypothetical protein
VTRKSVRNYDLDRPDPPPNSNEPISSMDTDPGQSPAIVNAFIGKRHLVLLGYGIDAGAPIPEGGAVTCRLSGYARYLAGGKESGLLDLDKPIVSEVKIDQWQPVEGGFYYHTADGIAHFLKGTADPQQQQKPG